jgi:hypothetical protein
LNNAHPPHRAAPAGGRHRAQIVVFPTNVALVSPPVEQLEPLADYRSFVMADGESAGGPPGEDLLDNPGVAPGSAFPAGLVPGFHILLATAGYRVTVDDRRRLEQGFRIDPALCRSSHPEARALLQAVVAQPLGQVPFQRRHELVWRIALLCHIFREARTLIVADSLIAADDLCQELADRLGASTIGLLPAEGIRKRPRCQVTSTRWLSRLRPGRWPFLLLVVFHNRTVSAAYESVVGLHARRVYNFIGADRGFGKVNRVRLEAMSGGMIHPQATT